MRIPILIISIIFSQFVFSQSKIKLQINYTDKPEQLSSKIKNFRDTSSVYGFLNNKISKLISMGYISASIDSMVFSDTTKAYIFTGKKFTWGEVSFAKEFNIIENNKLQKSIIKNKKIEINEIEQKIENTLLYFENNGYPFCSIKLDSVEIKDNTINCTVELNKNKQISIDSIIIKGNAKISEKYLQQYLDLKPGDSYNEKKISSITKKINNLNFITETQASNVLFYKDKIKIILYLDKKQASRFDGILGVIPRDKTSGRLLITGEINLLLVNSFAHGESFGFNWKKTDDETQTVDLVFDYPYIFSTILGIGGNFNLLKQDTSYLNLRFKALLNFIITNNNRLNLFIENKNTSLLSANQYANATVLPAFADTKLTLYGIGLNLRNTDRFFSPMSGYVVYIEGSIGEKQIEKNSKLPQYLYDDIMLKSLQIESRLSIATFIKIKKRTSFKIANQTKYISNDNLFANELYRFGGLKSIRGFKEGELFADFINISTIQLNYYYERYSSFYVFSDFAYYENHVNEFVHDTPIGIGVGADFSSKAGVFTISYAIGKQFNNTFDLQTARIHFGYIAQF